MYKYKSLINNIDYRIREIGFNFFVVQGLFEDWNNTWCTLNYNGNCNLNIGIKRDYNSKKSAEAAIEKFKMDNVNFNSLKDKI